MENDRSFGISGLALKLMAVVTMAIDHIGAAGLVGWGDTYTAFRLIGRLAFPIYCFLLGEGAAKTKSPGRYLLRLFLFGLLSEIPYDLLFHRRLLEFGNQNIFFTLFLGLAGLSAYRWSRRFDGSWKELIGPAGMVLALLLAQFIHCDYGYQGVLLIYAMYMWRNESWGRSFLYVPLLLLFFGSFWKGTLQLAALLAFLPLAFYNGERGYRVNKYVFYAFYPVHLLLILAACYLLGTRTDFWGTLSGII